MKYLVKNGAIRVNGDVLLDNVNFEINDFDHIGIVGKNGAGKTTLLKSLIDNEMLEEGIEDISFEVRKIGNFSIGYLEQITFDNENNILIDEVKKSFSHLLNLEKKINMLLEKMTKDNSDKNILEYTEALEKYKILGGYTYKKEYEIMLNKFGFSESDKLRNISSFSGGERTKIAFIKLLLSKPDILFLDEPTNHLDVEAIIWLEEYLKNYKGAFVVVSHDRMFLNNIVNIIYDLSHGKVIKYVGNYENFEKTKKLNYEKAIKDYEKQQKEIENLKNIYEKFRNKPTKASMALSRLHKLEKMVILDKPDKINEKTFKTNLDKMDASGKIVLTCKDLVVGYDKPLAKLNLEINRGQKIGVIGANGTGKSTLLKTIYGVIDKISGSYKYGYNVNIEYFDQNLKMNNLKNTVLEEFRSVYPEILESDARKILGSFLFKGDDVFKMVSVLSGGEKVRLSLCKILYKNPNFLILDEPTNHMDILGKERLEEILKMYKGTIIFVSHDRYFVKKIADSLIVFDECGAKYYPYGYEEYMNKLCINDNVNNKIIKNENIKKEDKKVNLYNEKKKLNKLELEINKLENERNSLNKEFVNPNIYNDYEKAMEIEKKLKNIDEFLNELYLEWEKLSKIIEEDSLNN